MTKRLKPLKNRTLIGLIEKVSLNGQEKKKDLLAKVDTGATKSSLDIALAEHLELGPIISSKMVKSAYGMKVRPIVEAEITVAGRTIRSEFTLADRGHMKYKVLIGQNILKQDFLIDPLKK